MNTLTHRQIDERDVSLMVVHRTCLELRGTTQYGGQTCGCGPGVPWAGCDVSRLASLCMVCARDTAGGVSRWAWLGCAMCVATEVELRQWLGVCVLPLGRHSIMNGVGRRLSEAPLPAGDHVSANLLRGMQRSWTQLREWGAGEALARSRELTCSAREVPVPRWRQSFPVSPETSLDAYERMLEVQLPSMLREKIATRFEARRATHHELRGGRQ